MAPLPLGNTVHQTPHGADKERTMETVEQQTKLIRSRPLTEWEKIPSDLDGILDHIRACPVEEVRLEAIERLRRLEVSLHSETREIERLYRELETAGDGSATHALLHSYIAAANSFAIASATEFVLQATRDCVLDQFGGEICNKLCTAWNYSSTALFEQTPSLMALLERGLALDGASQQQNSTAVSEYDESHWFGYKRALKLITRFALACGQFVPLLESHLELMRLGFLVPSSCAFRGEHNNAKLRAMHQIDLQYSLADIKLALAKATTQ